eukprot:UN17575
MYFSEDQIINSFVQLVHKKGESYKILHFYPWGVNFGFPRSLAFLRPTKIFMK